VRDVDATPASQSTITSANARQEGIKKEKNKLRVVISKQAVAWQLVLVFGVSEDFTAMGLMSADKPVSAR
jgi:hypothetical protein